MKLNLFCSTGFKDLRIQGLQYLNPPQMDSSTRNVVNLNLDWTGFYFYICMYSTLSLYVTCCDC